MMKKKQCNETDELSMKTVLITGANGFIGQAICQHFFGKYKLILFDSEVFSGSCNSSVIIKGCITDNKLLKTICQTYRPDMVIHCAGIAHQKIFRPMDKDAYETINSIATENIAMESVKYNPEVHFIFLSSISVYGEDHNGLVEETDKCNPTSDYAVSKLRAEIRLLNLYNKKLIKKLDILRLCPVYDEFQSLNLDKRVFAPNKFFYIKFGSGHQKMSVLSKQTLVGFIDFLVKRNDRVCFGDIFNVCDLLPCTFNDIISLFKLSKYQPDRWILPFPLGVFKILIQIASFVFKSKSIFLKSCYKKIANNFIFDNERMLATGFRPRSSLKSVFLNEKK